MLDQAEVKRAVDLRKRSYRLLRWMADAVAAGGIGVNTMQPDLAFVQALRGSSLSEADRSTLDADHLFLLTLRETIELTPAEKDKLTADHVFILAMRGAVTLTAEDKKSLPDDHLFMLALRGVAHLTQEDKERLPSDDLTHLQMRGLA